MESTEAEAKANMDQGRLWVQHLDDLEPNPKLKHNEDWYNKDL